MFTRISRRTDTDTGRAIRRSSSGRENSYSPRKPRRSGRTAKIFARQIDLIKRRVVTSVQRDRPAGARCRQLPFKLQHTKVEPKEWTNKRERKSRFDRKHANRGRILLTKEIVSFRKTLPLSKYFRFHVGNMTPIHLRVCVFYYFKPYWIQRKKSSCRWWKHWVACYFAFPVQKLTLILSSKTHVLNYHIKFITNCNNIYVFLICQWSFKKTKIYMYI